MPMPLQKAFNRTVKDRNMASKVAANPASPYRGIAQLAQNYQQLAGQSPTPVPMQSALQQATAQTQGQAAPATFNKGKEVKTKKSSGDMAKFQEATHKLGEYLTNVGKKAKNLQQGRDLVQFAEDALKFAPPEHQELARSNLAYAKQVAGKFANVSSMPQKGVMKLLGNSSAEPAPKFQPPKATDPNLQKLADTDERNKNVAQDLENKRKARESHYEQRSANRLAKRKQEGVQGLRNALEQVGRQKAGQTIAETTAPAQPAMTKSEPTQQTVDRVTGADKKKPSPLPNVRAKKERELTETFSQTPKASSPQAMIRNAAQQQVKGKIPESLMNLIEREVGVSLANEGQVSPQQAQAILAEIERLPPSERAVMHMQEQGLRQVAGLPSAAQETAQNQKVAMESRAAQDAGEARNAAETEANRPHEQARAGRLGEIAGEELTDATAKTVAQDAEKGVAEAERMLADREAELQREWAELHEERATREALRKSGAPELLAQKVQAEPKAPNPVHPMAQKLQDAYTVWDRPHEYPKPRDIVGRDKASDPAERAARRSALAGELGMPAKQGVAGLASPEARAYLEMPDRRGEFTFDVNDPHPEMAPPARKAKAAPVAEAPAPAAPKKKETRMTPEEAAARVQQAKTQGPTQAPTEALSVGVDQVEAPERLDFSDKGASEGAAPATATKPGRGARAIDMGGKTLRGVNKGLGAAGLYDTVADVGNVAKDPRMSKEDVASEIGGQMVKGGGAGAGASLGALAGMAGGPFAPFTVPLGGLAGGVAGYFGGEKLLEAGREWMGKDAASPAARAEHAIPTLGDIVENPKESFGKMTGGVRSLLGLDNPAKPATPAAQTKPTPDQTQPANKPGTPVKTATPVQETATTRAPQSQPVPTALRGVEQLTGQAQQPETGEPGMREAVSDLAGLYRKPTLSPEVMAMKQLQREDMMRNNLGDILGGALVGAANPSALHRGQDIGSRAMEAKRMGDMRSQQLAAEDIKYADELAGAEDKYWNQSVKDIFDAYKAQAANETKLGVAGLQGQNAWNRALMNYNLQAGGMKQNQIAQWAQHYVDKAREAHASSPDQFKPFDEAGAYRKAMEMLPMVREIGMFDAGYAQ